MEIKVSNEILKALKVYFTMQANGSLNKKTIPEIQWSIKCSNRYIRETIRLLRRDHGMAIAVDVNEGGYFLVEKDNLHDIKIMQQYVNRQLSKSNKLRQGVKVFDQFYPKGQILITY